MVSLSGIATAGKRVATGVSEKNVTFMAAGIAYNAFISLVPVLLLLLLVATAIGGGIEDSIVEVARRSLPRPIADVIVQVFQGGSPASGASFIGITVLVWGSLKIFRGLDTAFSEIYETTADNSFTDQLRDGLVVFVGLVVATVATVAGSAVFAAFADSVPYLNLVTPLTLVAGLCLAFFPMYYFFPDADLDWRQVLPGVVVAAVGWATLQGVFQVYLAFKGGGSTGFFGGVIVVVTWLYFSGLVLLLGAVVNAVVGGHSSSAPGGVGRGAAGRSPERETKLNRDELAEYLHDLREELTRRYEGMRPMSDAGSTDSHCAPDGDVELLEYVSPDENGREWTVVLRWRTTAGPQDDARRTAESDGPGSGLNHGP